MLLNYFELHKSLYFLQLMSLNQLEPSQADISIVSFGYLYLLPAQSSFDQYFDHLPINNSLSEIKYSFYLTSIDEDSQLINLI